MLIFTVLHIQFGVEKCLVFISPQYTGSGKEDNYWPVVWLRDV
jgi:hypothetical protein